MSYQLQLPGGRLPPPARMPLPALEALSVTSSNPDKSEALPPEAEVKEDWIVQMEKLKDLEDWAARAERQIPADVKPDLTHLIESFPGLQRIHIYVLLEALFWELGALKQFWDVISNVEQILKMPAILFLESLLPRQLLTSALDLFEKMPAKAVMDFIHTLEQPHGEELVDLAKYQPIPERQCLASLLAELGAATVHKLLKEVKLSPTWKKHCDLCRTRRLHSLEQHMVHGLRPPDKPPLAALVTQYDHPDLLTASECRGFSFDPLLGKIFWFKHEVDLVHICETCAREAHEAVSVMDRHVEVHHVEAEERKQLLRRLRDIEAARSEVVGRIAHTRALRRLRECLQRALGHWQHGKAEEQRALQQRAQEAAQRKEREDARGAHQALLDGALGADQFWRGVDRRSDLKALRKRMDFAQIMKHLGYSQARPAPKQRKHSKSWQLQDLDADGLPLSEEAARKMFGYEVQDAEPEDVGQLDQWRSIADRKATAYQERRDARKAEQRREELRRFEELKDYVRERLTILDRHQKRMLRVAEQAEEDRLAKRAAEREARRGARFEQYLAEERQRMAFEDVRSGQARLLQFEVSREQLERARMWEEERDQCERDRFWGLDFYENSLRREELRLRRFYEQRVRLKNAQLGIMGATTPAGTPSLTVFGSLPEDRAFDDNDARRLAVIRKLKAEEVRSQLRRVHLPFAYT